MKTVKFISTLILLLAVINLNGQYLETFSNTDKGIVAGPCGATASTCTTNDFSGVDWDVNGDLSGIGDAEDFVKTDGAALIFEDIDEEVCFETPVLDISTVAGNFSISVDVGWFGFDEADYIHVEYMIDGGIWVQVPNVIGGGAGTIQFVPASNNAGSTTVTETGLSGTSTLSIRICGDINLGTISGTLFEQFSVDNVSVPEAGAMVLPVKWADVKVRSLKEGNQLDWATYTEVNNEKFEIEKSVDNMLNFRKVGSVDGAGNSLQINRYEFLDTEISNAISYYRIKQIDFDGNFEYSQVVEARNELKDRIRFSPNPFSSQLLISMDQGELVEGTAIRMYNNQGQLVLEKKISSLNLDDPINTQHLSAGMYTLQYSNGEVVRLVKF